MNLIKLIENNKFETKRHYYDQNSYGSLLTFTEYHFTNGVVVETYDNVTFGLRVNGRLFPFSYADVTNEKLSQAFKKAFDKKSKRLFKLLKQEM